MANIIFLPEIQTFGQNTSVYRSRITVAHVDVNIFAKNHFNLCFKPYRMDVRKRYAFT